jgi:hypothetical protein
MTPNGFWPTGTGGADYGCNCMPGMASAGGYGMNAGMGFGFPGNFQPGYAPGMGFAGNYQPGFMGMGYPGGFGQGTGLPGNFQPGFGMGTGFPGNCGPGMGFSGGFQPSFGSPYPGTFQPGFGMMPGMGAGFGGNFQPGFGQGTGPYFEEDETVTEAMNPTQFAPGPVEMGWGLGGGRRWGGTYSPQFMLTGLPTDDEIVEMVYDAIDNDPLIPYDADISVDSDAGTVTLTGTVMTKQVKHAAGDDAWWIPGVDDVHNALSVERRHPAHAAQGPGTETRQTRGANEMTAGSQNQRSETAQTPRATRRGATRR